MKKFLSILTAAMMMFCLCFSLTANAEDLSGTVTM